MGKLTQTDDLGNWGVVGLPWKNLYVGQVITKEVYEKLYGCLWKLMEYEDTGLSPEEVECLENISHFLIERKSAYQKKANRAFKQEQTAKHLLQDEPDREDVKDDLIQCIKLQDRYNALIEFIEELQEKISP